jgi:hypothetical protein
MVRHCCYNFVLSSNKSLRDKDGIRRVSKKYDHASEPVQSRVQSRFSADFNANWLKW